MGWGQIYKKMCRVLTYRQEMCRSTNGSENSAGRCRMDYSGTQKCEKQSGIVCIDCAGARLQHPPSWLRPEPFEESSDCCWHWRLSKGAHSHQNRIQTLEVDVNISSPAVIQAWKASRNKTRQGELRVKMRWDSWLPFEKKDQAAAATDVRIEMLSEVFSIDRNARGRKVQQRSSPVVCLLFLGEEEEPVTRQCLMCPFS